MSDRTARSSAPHHRFPPEVAAAIEAALDKKAQDLVVLDLRKSGAFADFFLVCSGRNLRHVQAVAEGIESAVRGVGARPAHREGSDRSAWILLDYFDFIVHVFTPEARAFYALERLWGSAKPIAIAAPGTPPPAPPG